MKTNSQQSFLFRFKFSSKQFPLPTQFRSFPLTYSTTCSTQTLPQLQLKPTSVVTWCIWEIKINVLKQTSKVHSGHSYSQSVVNQQSQHQVPLCLQCHDGSYLSLSQHSSTYTARQTTMLQASISSSPVSANVRQAPLFLHTTEPQVFNYSRLITKMWQLNQGHWQSKLDPPGSHAKVSLSNYHLQAWRQAQ